MVAIAVGGRAAGELFEGDRRSDLVVRLPEAFRRDVSALRRLPVPLAEAPAEVAGHGEIGSDLPGAFAYRPLDAVAEIGLAEGPSQVSRENGTRRIVVQANVRDRDLGSFVADARARVAAEVELPAGSWLVIDGLRAEGRPVDDAIREGALRRLRPVLMTALATGTGVEVQRPLATAVIAGLVSSTSLTLLVLPALYRPAAPRGRDGG